ncbi:hypothetical protein [Bacillus massilinigeriensis]|uniref:hypothetical protein n=1 Tax=Bacillus massilionigeriensis TaxID=1805475 RepID=UPI00096B2DC8|nr:hypothetical protein [Bacillus massilionigeriensis]
MFHSYVLALFLYFPEDKTEYIPAAIWLVIFMIAAVLTTRLIIHVSRKEAREAKKIEDRMNLLNEKESSR